jgi:hypothetical protein
LVHLNLILISLTLFIVLINPFIDDKHFRKDYDWVWLNIQTVVFSFYIMKVAYLALAIQKTGPLMRVVFEMSRIVVQFSFASLILIFLVAFAVHTAFLKYDSPYNKFQDLYMGILILYEFTFGAVEYIRKESPNPSNVLMNIFLVFFSFYGNIMLANILISYLSSRFEKINVQSLYSTKKMQFYLIKAYKTRDYDTIFVVPFWLNMLLTPIWIFWIVLPGNRENLNELMKQIAHFLLVVIPMLIFVFVWEFLWVILRYFGIFIAMTRRASSNYRKLKNFPLWIFVGPFLLLKLMCQDIWLAAIILANYGEAGISSTDFWPDYNKEDIDRYMAIYQALDQIVHQELEKQQKSRAKAKHKQYHFQDKKKNFMVKYCEFVYELMNEYRLLLNSSHQQIQSDYSDPRGYKGDFDSADDFIKNIGKGDKGRVAAESLNPFEIRNNLSDFRAKLREIQVYDGVCRQFIEVGELVGRKEPESIL